MATLLDIILTYFQSVLASIVFELKHTPFYSIIMGRTNASARRFGNDYYGCFGCFFPIEKQNQPRARYYLPQVELRSHTTIHSTASRTKLTQIFVNNTLENAKETQYTFPLYDGVSVVAFRCTIGDKVISGVVKEKNEARTEYKEAVARGDSAGLLEQFFEASDVFNTKIGNIPKDAQAIVEIEYVGELKHDAQLDGIRFSIPTTVAERYGDLNSDSGIQTGHHPDGRIEITVDVEGDEGAHIEELSSPSHPIAMAMGRTSTHKDEFKSYRASASLSLGSSELGKDFILVVKSQQTGIPRALLEQHPHIPHHRALMATLVPKFNLPNIHPEIVFVVDRSGSMDGKIPTLVEALKVFLKSLPLSAKFNICSFGSRHTFLFKKSKAYDEKSLATALEHVARFGADYGGTELLAPIKQTVKNRLGDVPLEIMVLTDGEIWNQQDVFDFVNGAAKSDVRLFSLGIGAGASTSLVEGLARSGHGFAQFVQDDERIDKGMVRMLKAALSPHITDYRLEVNYEEKQAPEDDDFEMIESTNASDEGAKSDTTKEKVSKPAPISLFDPNFQEETTRPSAGRYDHIPTLNIPKILQAPNQISGLFPYNRTTAYLLLPQSSGTIKSAVLKGTYNGGPIELEIPIQDIGLGQTIHQLAAKKAMLETEEGRGWLSTAVDVDGKLLRTKHNADWDRIVEREAVRLGVEFQVAGKFCSFVAVKREANKQGEIIHAPDPEQSQPESTSLFGRSNQAFSATSSFSGVALSAAPPPAPATFSLGSTPFSSNVKHKAAPGGPGGGSLRSRPFSIGNSPFAASVKQGLAKGGALFGGSPGISAAPSGGFSSSTGGLRGSSAQTSLSSVSDDRSRAPIPASSSFGNYPSFGSSANVRSDPVSFGFAPPAPASKPRAPRKQLASMATLRSYSQHNDDEAEEDEDDEERDPRSTSQFVWEEAEVDEDDDESEADEDDEEGKTFETELEDDAAAPRAAAVSDTTDDKMHKIIDLQCFDGSWVVDDQLFKLTDVSKAEFNDGAFKYDDATVRATILAIAWLEKQAAKDMEVWEMVVDKAKQWLADKHGIVDADEAVKQAIAVFFFSP